MKEQYRSSIISMLAQIENERFLRQIWTILNRHMKKCGKS